MTGVRRPCAPGASALRVTPHVVVAERERRAFPARSSGSHRSVRVAVRPVLPIAAPARHPQTLSLGFGHRGPEPHERRTPPGLRHRLLLADHTAPGSAVPTRPAHHRHTPRRPGPTGVRSSRSSLGDDETKRTPGLRPCDLAERNRNEIERNRERTPFPASRRAGTGCDPCLGRPRRGWCRTKSNEIAIATTPANPGTKCGTRSERDPTNHIRTAPRRPPRGRRPSPREGTPRPPRPCRPRGSGPPPQQHALPHGPCRSRRPCR